MTVEEVELLVRSQCVDNDAVENGHRISLAKAIVPPKQTSVIWRTIKDGRLQDTKLLVWIVGQENSLDGYKIIMQDDGKQFGLASSGFPTDRHLILVGWYDSLISAFLAV